METSVEPLAVSSVVETAEQATQRLEACFSAIEKERMADVPILNPVLRVRAVGTRGWQGQWLTALVTPWFLNLVLMPADLAAAKASGRADAMTVGTKRMVALPAGQFEFIDSHDEVLGAFAM